MDQNLFSFPLWAIPAEEQTKLFVIASVLATISLIYAAWFSYRERSYYPLFLFLAAGVSVFYEPLGDMLTKVVYPPLDQVSLMTSFGRPIPHWMLPNYFFFFCVPVLLALHFVVRKGVTAKKWWIAYALIVLFVGVFEQPGINAEHWRYYGTQAFSINTYPVWVAFVNAQSILLMATGVYLLRQTVISERLSFLFLLIGPMLFVASHVAPGLPVVSATYTTDNPLIINVAAILTISVCILNVWIGFILVSSSRTVAANSGVRTSAPAEGSVATST